ncbi:MAG: hypothetical protein AB7U82_16725 [Blastocatellales bacterium]
MLFAVLFVFAAAALSLAAAAESRNTNRASGAEAAFNFSQDPGNRLAADSEISDQKAGSVLIYPFYCSLASASNMQNTRINITNTDTERSAFVHLFFVDGSNCSVSDAFVCLTAAQTTTFLLSDMDPGITGYLIAVAVDADGCPVVFNELIGDEYIKLGAIHAANLGAVAVSALPKMEMESTCSSNSATAQLNFDGVDYNMLPRVLAADNLPDRTSGNETLLIVNRIGGSLVSSAAKLESVFGMLYDDAENGYSFSFNFNVCQFRAILSNNFPRTAPRYTQIIPAGRSGWMKLWSYNDAAIIGAMINFNPNHKSNPGSFNQGHNLHTLTLTDTATLTIPIFPPSC